jgi:hypothetical protein
MGRVRHGAARTFVTFVVATFSARPPTAQLERRPNLAGPTVVSRLRAAVAPRVPRGISPSSRPEHAVEF